MDGARNKNEVGPNWLRFKFKGKGQRDTHVIDACTFRPAFHIPTQLAALLGRGTMQIRKTNETPPRISTIDVAIPVTGKTHHDAAQDHRRLLNQYPEVGTPRWEQIVPTSNSAAGAKNHSEVGPNRLHFKFRGRKQRDTRATDAKCTVEVIMPLSGQ